MESVFILSFMIFSITLLITKSKILAGKREFVNLRYEASKVNNQKPLFIHRIWHAIWTCSMCSGFWVGLFLALIFQFNFFELVCSFGINWLLHCIENTIFSLGKILEEIDDKK